MSIASTKAYIRSVDPNGTVGRHDLRPCVFVSAKSATPDSGLRFAELVFSAGFCGRAFELISHECLHAVMMRCTRGQLAKACGERTTMRSNSWPIRSVAWWAATVEEIYAVQDGIAVPASSRQLAARAMLIKRADA